MSSQSQEYKADTKADTTIALSRSTRERIKKMKRGGESYDELLSRLADHVDPEVGLHD